MRKLTTYLLHLQMEVTNLKTYAIFLKTIDIC